MSHTHQVLKLVDAFVAKDQLASQLLPTIMQLRESQRCDSEISFAHSHANVNLINSVNYFGGFSSFFGDSLGSSF
jgi:hypothetical protein